MNEVKLYSSAVRYFCDWFFLVRSRLFFITLLVIKFLYKSQVPIIRKKKFDMRFTYTIKSLENIILNLNKFRNVMKYKKILSALNLNTNWKTNCLVKGYYHLLRLLTPFNEWLQMKRNFMKEKLLIHSFLSTCNLYHTHL